MILCHAGLSRIKQFDLSNGCHFGGRVSALEAALRKVELFVDTTIYLHKIRVPDEAMCIYETFDAGCEENWKSVIDYIIYSGYNSVKYTNKYEPSLYPSFILLQELSSNITLESTVAYSSDKIEQYLSAHIY